MSSTNCDEKTLDQDQPPTEPVLFAKADFEPCKDLTARLTIPPQFAITSGGRADIYRGHLQTEDGGGSTEVAVKIPRIKIPRDEEMLDKRVSHEAKIFIATQHRRIVKFYGRATAKIAGHSRPALVLKWYHNGNASQYLVGRTTREKFTVIKDMGMSLEYLHSQNIIHGDLKGANVLITETGKAVLTDFGLSHCIDKQTGATTSSNACSIRWLSPELAAIFLGANDVSLTVRKRTKESDVWAFGSTVFELLSGMLPYVEIEYGFVVAQKIADGTSPLGSPLSTALEPSTITPILQQCWQIQPAGRPTMSNVVRSLSAL